MAGDDMVMIRGCKNTRAVTVLLRGANDYMLDEMDRSLHDALSIVKRVLESGTVVAGEAGRHCCGLHIRLISLCSPRWEWSWQQGTKPCGEGLWVNQGHEQGS